MGNFKDAGKRSGSSDHQLQTDPQIPCGCHGKNKYISSTDWKPSDQEFNRIINVPVQHADRAYGKSGYSFKRLLKDLIYDITTHTAFPLLLVRNIGIVSFLISVVLSVCYLVRYFTLGISVQGWTSLMLVMLAFFGLILLSIGIMGIYLMNILNEAKKMPHYVIRREDTDE